MQWAKQKGFTIVELLIVVVVIAILAAITIVAYNGISNRAKENAAMNAASQAFKKVATAAVTTADLYPTDAAFASSTGFTSSADGSTPYQYTVSSDLKTFCLTVTTGTLSYYVSSAQSTPVKGSCFGHRQNGVAVITNLVANPSVEENRTDWEFHNALLGPGSGRIQVNGEWKVRGVRTSAGAATAIYIMRDVPMTVTPNTVYAASLEVTASADMQFTLIYRRPNATTYHTSAMYNLVAGQTTTVTTSVNVGSETSLYLVAYVPGGATGDSITIDKAMFTAGPTLYTYADGNSPGWMWSGAPNSSTSSGPAL